MKKAISIILVFFLCCGCFFSLGNSFVFAEGEIFGGDSFDTAPLLTEQISSVIVTSEQFWNDMGEMWAPKGHIFKFIPSESGDYTLTIKSDWAASDITVKNSKNEDIGYAYIGYYPGSADVTVNEIKAGEPYYIDIYACDSHDLNFTVEFDKPLMSSEPEPGSGSTPLEQVSDVVLSNTGVATWKDVSNESSYDIQLYKNGEVQGDVVNVDANVNCYDFLSAMRAVGGGTYTVKVTAKGDGSTYSDGLQSEASLVQTVIQLEPVSSGLIWNVNVAHWDLVSNAISYDVQLFKDGSSEDGVVNVLEENAVNGVDFAAVMEAAGDGTYTYKVTAKGNDTLIMDGAPSDFSNDNIQTTNPDNFGFEGELIGWNTYGSVTVAETKLNVQAASNNWEIRPKGTKMAVLIPSGVSGAFNATADALGLSNASRDYITKQFPNITNCAYIYCTIDLEAGQEFSMGWNYVATDYTPFNDASFASLVNMDNASEIPMVNGVYGEVSILGATVKGTGNYSTGDYGSTGWQVATFHAISAGTYKLGFTVFNLSDTGNSPYFFLDDGVGSTFINGIEFEPIPRDDDAPPPPSTKSIIYDPTVFIESNTNNGSIETVSTISLTEDTFVGNNGDKINGVSFANIPEGLTPVINKTSDTTAELIFIGSANEHASCNNVNNFTIIFMDEAFSSNNAESIVGSNTDYLSINFKDESYTLSYLADEHGSIEGVTLQIVNEGESGTPVTAVPAEGYYFDKWSDNVTSATRTDSNVTANIFATAIFKINQYTVSFESNGGNIVDSITADYSSTITEPVEPTKEGYSFGGWYKEEELTNEWNFETDKITAKDITLYAKWVVPQESITMIASPDSVEISENFNHIFTINIQNDTVTEAVYAEDLSLGGVFSSLSIGEVNNTSTTVAISVYGTLRNIGVGTITLNADKLAIRTSPLSADIMVAAKPIYTVIYDGNGAISGTVPKDNNSYEEGDIVTVLANTGNILKTGYTLVGWNTKIDGSGTNYAAGESFNMSTGNVTLYAKWKTKKFTVTFKDYDGRILETQTVEHGSNATAPDSPTRNGYTFTGWNTSFTNVTSDLIITAAYINNSSSIIHNNDKTELTSTSEPGITVIVNGIEQTAGTELVKEENGEKTVELRVEAEILSEKIDEVLKEKEASGKEIENVVEIVVAAKDANNIKSILTGDMVKKMEESEFSLAVNTDKIYYIIPAKEIGIEQIAINLGIKEEALKEIEVEVHIEKVNEAKVKEIITKAKASGYDIIFPPVEFRVVAKSKSGRINETKVSKFSSYVQRVMEIPEGVEPDKITTGIICNPDGTFSHIPTSVFKKDGKWYAKLNSLTNSSYSVISNPITVKSVENHWSKEYVNDMASRLVIKNPETFIPDEAITRSDFAEYITKALGIYRTGVAETGKFTDITLSHKASDAITIAAEYGIIKGYPDGTFRPDSKISREEAMVMFAKAMEIAGLKEADNNRIESYTDKEEIGAWAYEAVKKIVSVGVFNGRTGETIDPKGTFTYAEAVTAIRNLLTEAGLIR